MAGEPRAKRGVLPEPRQDSRPVTNGSNDYSPSHRSTTPAAATSEDTPLLGSGTTSPRQRQQQIHDDDAVQHYVTPIRGLCISFSMWILMFMQACNMSGMTMVQSAIAEELEAYELVMWFTSAYLITVASCAPLAGRLATIFSPGVMILFSGFFFAIGAIVTSQAHSFTIFILGRVLTGIGGGGIMTLALILVLQLTSRKRRGLFIGLVNMGFTIGVSAGAVVFGALLPAMGWRALFWAQAPVGVLAGTAVYFSIPTFSTAAAAADEPPPSFSKDKTVLQKLKTIDYAGAALLTGTIVLFLYGLSGTIQILPMLLSAIPLLLFIFVEYKVSPDPLIPVSVLQSRGVLFSCLAQLGFMAARWTVLYYAPIFVLAVRGLPPTVSGAVLVPTNLGFGVGGVAVGWLHVRRAGSFWLPCLVSVALFGLALFGLSLTSTAAAPAWLYVLLVFLNGACTGAALNYTLAHILHLATPETHYISTGLLATFRGFAGSFGTSIGGGIFMRALRGHLTVGFERLDGTADLTRARVTLIKRLVGSPSLVQSGILSEAEREIAVKGYEVALNAMYTAAVGLIVLVLFVQAGTGWTEPSVQESEEEIEEEIAEHDGRMEV
ncbi:Vacuolar basic amino acid transporter 1 [Cytospora mali]|uniref:Vacuolar basic amino acid transporter 1 n=1 Tax=Cytospora mali TaxID=578113 RepID=A0A194WDM2_CYTMA|nr:Vacuolar basic amino acid transporter 1 [Valsa mali]